MKNTDKPASDALLLGALFALEQCGLLLNDAAALVELRRYPTAAGVALLAREELGRHKILLKFWRDAKNGVFTTTGALKTALEDHEDKQRQSSSSLFYRMERGDQMDRLTHARLKATPGTDEWRAADEQLRIIDERRLRREPKDRHDMRMRAFYVDLGDRDVWLLPQDLQLQKCADEVNSAQNDYRVAKLRVEEAASVHQDSQLADAVSALVARPFLPEPVLISTAAALPASG